MNSVEIIVKKLKLAIAKLERQVKIGVRNDRKYILTLVDVQDKLAAIEAAIVAVPVKSTPVQLNLLDFIKEDSPKTKTKRFLSPKHYKPQSNFSNIVRNKAKKITSEWLQRFGLDIYHCNLLATELLDRAINQKIAEVSDSAPDIYLSDQSKIDSLVFNMRHIAMTLDESEELENLLDELVNLDAQRDGNSI